MCIPHTHQVQRVETGIPAHPQHKRRSTRGYIRTSRPAPLWNTLVTRLIQSLPSSLSRRSGCDIREHERFKHQHLRRQPSTQTRTSQTDSDSNTAMSSNESTTLPPQAPRRQSFTLPFPSYTSPIALAAAQTLRRSSTTGTGRPRADSMSSLSSSVASSIPADDVPIEEEEEGANPGEMRARLERRMSAGRGWVRPRAGSLSLGTLPGQGSVGQGSPTITRGELLLLLLQTRTRC